jgi:hypothetical protein
MGPCRSHAQHLILLCSLVAFVDSLGISTLLSVTLSLDMLREGIEQELSTLGIRVERDKPKPGGVACWATPQPV